MNLITTNYNLITQPETAVFSLFSDFARDYINRMEKGYILTDKKVEFSDQSIRLYKNALEHYEKFETLLERKTQVSEVNRTFLQAYERYLISQGLALNTVSVYISKIKSLCNILASNDVIKASFKGVKTRSEQTTQVYLTETEISKMKSAELTNSEANVLNMFLICCFTGFRFSTLQKFAENPLAYIRDHEGTAYIDIVADKTGEQSIIPMHIEVSRVISQYGGSLPKFSEQYFRRVIKNIARKAGIEQPIPQRITKGGKIQEVLVPKWKLVSSHTGRRSFATNILRYTTNKDAVRAITGHASEKQLDHYNRSSKIDKVLPILHNKFFKKSL